MSDDDDDPDTTEFSAETDSFSVSDFEDEESPLGEFVDSLDAPGDTMGGLAEGLDPSLADDLRSIVTGTGSKREMSIRSETSMGHVGMAPDRDLSHIESFSLDVDHEMANALLKKVYGALQEAIDRDGLSLSRDPPELVVGLPQYRVLQPWAWAEHDQPIEAVLPVDDVILVPGPMIHAVGDNRRMFLDYLREQESGGDES